jgi:hypothetical protein
VWGLPVDSAANGLCGAEDLFAAVCESPRKRFAAHGACNVDHLVKGDVAAVLDVLLLLAVTGRL